MSTQIGIVHLGARISQGTGLELGHDYVLAPMKNKRKSTENPLRDRVHNPKEWAYVRFLEWRDKNKLSAVKNLLFDFLKKEKIGYKKDGKVCFIRIKDEHETTPTEDTSSQKKEVVRDSPEKILTEYTRLKELHKKLPIYGVANIDQPDLLRGIAYFNYFDEEQAELALKIFSDAGFGVEKKAEKKCNLTFVLLTEGIDETKLSFGKGKQNEQTEDIFEWVLKKIYRKKIGISTKSEIDAISSRRTIYCGEPEIFQIKKELEESFGITMLIHSSNKKTSEIFLLLSEKAKNVYCRFKGNIAIYDLITILKDPEKEKTIKDKYSYKNKKMKKFSNVSEILTKQDFRLKKEGGRPYVQINILSANSTKVSLIGGIKKEKESQIARIKEILFSYFPLATLSMTKSGTSFVVSGDGIENKLRKKKRKIIAPPVEQSAEDDSLAHAENELRAIMKDPSLSNFLDKETRRRAEEYLQKQDTNARVKHLLEILDS